MSALHPLTNEELMEYAPSLFTNQPYHKASNKYHFIPTIEVINELRAHKWHPVNVQEAGVRNIEKIGYQRHLVRFRHLDDLINPQKMQLSFYCLTHTTEQRHSVSAQASTALPAPTVW
ncbi:hypothetical protein [Nitratiruptor tergarcus]|uniref:hypothetical protein n=1 Tax=Nitratiruptor tergarcus TaxID=269259 RepID=UPI0018D40BA0|nr:hypothetical protein [Nitratiruptor tergarcus]